LKDSIVLCGDPKVNDVKEEMVKNVKVFRWPVYSPSNAYHIPRKRNKLKEFLKRILKDVDIVHIHNAHAVFSVYSGLKVKEIDKKMKLVFTLHYIGLGRNIIRKILWKPWRPYVSKLMGYSDKVQALSNLEMRWILSEYPFVRSKITLIPNGVEEDVFNYQWKGSGDYIIFSGRIEKYKRVDLVPKLAEKLNLKALIVGEGSYKKVLLKKAKNVILLPPQPRNKYLELLANAKYAVNPSRNEALSIFVLESMAIGTPIYVSNIILKSVDKFIKNNSISVEDIDGQKLYLVKGGEIPSWDKIVNRIVNELYSF